jgi:anti-sigma B factor antagonist
LKSSLANPADLEIIVDDGSESTNVLRLKGRLGIDSSPALRDRFLAMLRSQSPKALVVDLVEVSYIDTSGVATLLEALKWARNRQTTLCLKGLQGRPLHLFEVAGVLPLFETSGCRNTSAAELKVS